MTAFVLGNGRSRDFLNVDDLLKIGQVYGCNALYRTHRPTVLVATDRQIAEAIQQSGYSQNNRFYTRRPIDNLGALQVPKKYHGFSSGPIAMGIAAADGHPRIYLLGFDMGPTEHGLFNNIYADTEFYKKSTMPPTFTGNWIRQMSQVITDHPKSQFIRVFGANTAAVSEFDSLCNLQSLDLDAFVARINNPKDL